MKPGLRKASVALAAIIMLVQGGMAEAKRKPAVSPRKSAKPVVPVPAPVPLPAVVASAVGIAKLNERLLAAHNRERAAAGVPALVWSDALAADARLWAEKMAQTREFEHAPTRTGKDDQGENLWMGTKGAYSPDDMVGSWIDEKKLFKRGPFPKVSTSGNWVDVGHYTQLIWHNSVSVGCAVSQSPEDDYLVCRYSPPGNWMGQDPLGARK